MSLYPRKFHRSPMRRYASHALPSLAEMCSCGCAMNLGPSFMITCLLTSSRRVGSPPFGSYNHQRRAGQDPSAATHHCGGTQCGAAGRVVAGHGPG